MKRKEVQRFRARILAEAKRKGSISNARARAVAGIAQCWYHLAAMRKAGLLRHKDFNVWVPGPKA